MPSPDHRIEHKVSRGQALRGEREFDHVQTTDNYRIYIGDRPQTLDKERKELASDESDSDSASKYLAGYSIEGLNRSSEAPTTEIPESITYIQHGSTSMPLNMGTSLSRFSKLKLAEPTKDDRAIADRLYGVRVDEGITSETFKVQCVASSTSDTPDQNAKVAVKRLQGSRTEQEFLNEYSSLRRVNALRHPNIVETLSSFLYEDRGIRYFNFAFPLALGNLEQLFSAGHTSASWGASLIPLWSQFASLASALAYLHDSASLAHRYIQSYNILVYRCETANDLILKISDFGLSIDLTDALRWKRDMAPAWLAWDSDFPKLKSTYPQDRVRAEVTPLHLLTPAEVMANDVWGLGCVFTKLLTYLVWGAVGIRASRDSIGIGIDLDVVGDKRVNSGEKFKPRVLHWIEKMASDNRKAAQLEPLLKKMLSDPDQRPKAQSVCSSLLEMPFNSFNISYFDGFNIVKMIPAEQAPKPSFFDRARLRIENSLGRRIDWTPFPSIVDECKSSQILVTWQQGSRNLSVVLSDQELVHYKETCFPILNSALENSISLLPLHQASESSTSAPSTQQSNPSLGTRVMHSQNTQSRPRHIEQHNQSDSPNNPRKEIYWCIDAVYTEPLETILRPITDEQSLLRNSVLYTRINLEISSVNKKNFRRWLFRLMSWKRCTEVDFIKFHILEDGGEQVLRHSIELPPKDNSANFEHGIQDSTNVHMRILARNIVAGLMIPNEARGKSVSVILPKKRIPPELTRVSGTECWGLHVKMGFSVMKFLQWLSGCLILSAVFVVVWLSCVNSMDLQNAFVPPTIIIGALGLILGMIQTLEQ